MSEFKLFKKAVARQYTKMQATKLFRVNLDKDNLWNLYLDSFPEGTNNIYKERREYDCNCCKSFIRAVGNVVTIDEGELVSIWDLELPHPFQPVADALAKFVKSHTIDNVFLHPEPHAGVDKNHQDTPDGVITWEHFFVVIPTPYYVNGPDMGSKLSDYRSTFDVMKRSLTEITDDAISTVLELIDQGSLYRGEEKRWAVASFATFKEQFNKVADKDLFCWSHVWTLNYNVARIRNDVIGTLLTDLSEGKPLEASVKAYETKVAPTNYQRPTALVTKDMINRAQQTVVELGLESALSRRFAVIEDITVNNIIFADRKAKVAMGNVFDELKNRVPENLKHLDKVEEIGIDAFIQNVLPKAESVEVLFENRNSGNLVSLIAPVDPEAGAMFKWHNNFSWAYKGDIADSMRERVAALGGRVDGALRFTHSWNHPEIGRNASLMDLHVFMPGSVSHKEGCHDFYPLGRRVGWNNRGDRPSGGIQDVDYVNPAPEGYIPVENISFPNIKKMPEGKYVFKIHNWQLRAPTESGFRAEIEFDGQIFKYEHPKPLKNKEWVTLAEVTLKDGVFTIEHKLKSDQQSATVWNLATQKFHRAEVIMYSPNHWDEKATGNKHYFFMLDGCVNDGQARGFFNEFLKDDLHEHRKVFEILGSKMKVEPSDRQLSGLGLSSTQRNHIFCRVKGAFTRTLKVVF